MKPLLFRFRIAVLSLLVSGVVLVGFGVFFLMAISHVGLARIDSQIRALGETQVRTSMPRANWSDFDESLHFIFGRETPDPFAVRVLATDGEELFRSDSWPSELDDLEIPRLRTVAGAGAVATSSLNRPPRDGQPASSDESHARGSLFVRRLDRDGDNRVSRDEFDGPTHGFSRADSNGDGYLTADEAPSRPPIGGWPDDGPDRGPDFGSNQRRPPIQLGAKPKVPAFQTHKTAEGEWRVGFMGNQDITLLIVADLSSFRKEVRFFRNAFLVATPVALLILALAGWWIASRALRPVTLITRTAEAITARGLNRRVPDVSADVELQRLVDVINGMFERLEKSFHQAARFSADAAHELQTPLTVLQGELDNAVQAAIPGSEEQQRYSSLLEEISGLKSIVQKLLLLARADVGRLPHDSSPIDMSELIGSALEDVEAMAEDVTVEALIPDGVAAMGDAQLVGQVVRNMTSNALKYGEPGGTLWFDLRQQDGKVRFTLSNTGEPISAEHRERVFDRFYRVDKARSRRIYGSGLGLSLSRVIARSHGGDLVLEPTQAGKVSFTLTLPGAPAV